MIFHHHLVLYKTLSEGVAQDHTTGFVLETGLEFVGSQFPVWCSNHSAKAAFIPVLWNVLENARLERSAFHMYPSAVLLLPMGQAHLLTWKEGRAPFSPITPSSHLFQCCSKGLTFDLQQQDLSVLLQEISHSCRTLAKVFSLPSPCRAVVPITMG